MNKILKCIIIDDEEGAHLVLRHYIKDLKQLQLKESFIILLKRWIICMLILSIWSFGY